MAGLKTSTGDESTTLTTNLFGMPYQFTKQVDPRLENMSSLIGRRYLKNVLMEAPIVTIIPGKAAYLPGKKTSVKQTLTGAFINAMASSNVSTLQSALDNTLGKDKYLRLYDFTIAYEEYIQYVNALCRAAACMMEIGNYEFNGVKLANYNWRNYQWTPKSSSERHSNLRGPNDPSKKVDLSLGDGQKDKKALEVIDLFEYVIKSNRFVRFYVESDSLESSDGVTSQSKETQLKSIYTQMTDTMKDVSFMLGSGGASDIDDFLQKTGTDLSQYIGGFLGSAITDESSSVVSSGLAALSRIVNLSGNAIRGENLAIPNIWGNSSRTNDYTISLKLRTPYGNKLGYYFDILVPMLFACALGFPKQTTANTFASPFLVKVYVEGQYSCSLGLVTGVSIRKTGESRSVDGYPCEVEVSLQIEDLYPNLTISPANNAEEFVANSALIEFLATNSGLSITNPCIEKKVQVFFNTYVNRFLDIPGNISNVIEEQFSNLFNWARIV